MIIRWEKDQDYYLVHVHQDMFGDWLVTRVWGITGTQYGGLKHTLVNSPEEAETLVNDVQHIQESRGFHKVFEVKDGQAIPDHLQNTLNNELAFKN